MKISRKDLDIAEQQGILTTAQSEQLMKFLEGLPNQEPAFNFTNVLYYFGGFIAIAAMTLFMTLGWEEFGPWGLFAISVAYGVAGLGLAILFHSKGYGVPASLCATFAVCVTPLAIYALQQATGTWPVTEPVRYYHRSIEWHWLYIELGTLAVGIVVAWIYRYPLLVLPVAVTLYYLGLDLASMLTGNGISLELLSLVSSHFGFLMICLAFWVDMRSRQSADYAFWLYLFGVILFASALGCLLTDNLWERFEYFVVCLLLICLGVLLVRWIFVISVAFGCAYYLGYLASVEFLDSWLFPVSLTFIGLAMILLGILWQKNQAHITDTMRSYLPAALRELLAQRVAMK